MTTLSVPVVRSVPRGLDAVLALVRVPEVALGASASILAFAGSWIPSYWGDEGASILSAERSLPSLWSELQVVDAVHGVYYLLLHVWIHFFGASELATRLPSAVAIGFAVAGTVTLARRWWGRRVAWTAGVLAIAVPTLTNLGMEARSYAFSMAITVWLTVLLLRLVRRGSRWGWAGYGVAVAGSSYLFLYLLLLLPLHAGVMLLLRTPGRAWRRWAIAATGAVVAAVPILLMAYGQRAQISFLSRRDYINVGNVVVKQWFDQPFAGVVAWILLGAAVVWVVSLGGRRALALSRRLGATAVMAGGVTVILIAGNVLTPLYNLRYTSSAIPAVAVMMGVGAVGLGRMLGSRVAGRRLTPRGGAALVTIVAVTAFAAASLPSYLGQRSPFGKGGSDLRQVSDVMGRVSHRGDAVVFDQSVLAHKRPRLAIHLYPDGFRGLEDVALVTPYQDVRGLWDKVLPTDALSGAVAGHQTVWAIESAHDGSPDVRALEAAGYRPVAWYPVHEDVAVKLVSNHATWLNAVHPGARRAI